MFLPGDTFIVPRNGFTGTIIGKKEDSYLVKWSHFEGEHNYKESDANNWEKAPNSCNHKIEEYIGFRESYLFCVTCGKH